LGCPGIRGLAQAKKLPPGLKQSEAIRKARQLRFAAHMKNWLGERAGGVMILIWLFQNAGNR
jgi:hypothetical protein